MKIFQSKALIWLCLLFININSIIISKTELKQKKPILTDQSKSIESTHNQDKQENVIKIPQRELSLKVNIMIQLSSYKPVSIFFYE